jgi:2,4-dienoyl-CoA reductase-like NADH-dependent reductase (Old Yellow Enzyme family)
VSFERLLAPGRIGGVELPNRIVRTAHGTSLAGTRGHLNDDLIEYHVNQSRGGAGLSILEIASVDRSSPGGLRAYDDRIVPGWERLAERMAPLGGRLFQQLWHGGAQSMDHRRAPWSASAVQPSPSAQMPVPMTKGQIDEIVAAFAAAAARAAGAGLDGVELHFAHGYLVQQFLSPLSNRREDEYGGPLDNRVRFGQEILAAVRAAVPAEFAVGVRLSPEEIEGGLNGADNAEIARILAAGGGLDFVDASLGSYFHLEKFIGGMYEPAGYQFASSREIAGATELPTIATGRITLLAEAEAALADGVADFIGLTRAHIADPAIVAKTLAGRAEEVRPCIACDMCVASMNAGRIACTVNPGAGRELSHGDHRLAAAGARRRVVVIGGGPAGLEAARVARSRGHEVILLERSDGVGGQLRIARRAPNRGRIGAIAEWLEREARRLGVELRLGVEADVATVAALEPDLTLLATGSEPGLDGVQMAAPAEPMQLEPGARLVSSWELLEASEPHRGTALVVDERGHYEAIAAAERLVEDGAEVEFVTGHSSFGHRVEASFEPGPALRRMMPTGRLRVHTRTLAVSAGGARALLRDADGGPEFEVAADQIVFVAPNRPRAELLEPLRQVGLDARPIGDALSQRDLLSAIGDGHDAAASA